MLFKRAIFSEGRSELRVSFLLLPYFIFSTFVYPLLSSAHKLFAGLKKEGEGN